VVETLKPVVNKTPEAKPADTAAPEAKPTATITPEPPPADTKQTDTAGSSSTM
jgi:hypothetical protein